jgi:hypothetical protein
VVDHRYFEQVSHPGPPYGGYGQPSYPPPGYGHYPYGPPGEVRRPLTVTAVVACLLALMALDLGAAAVVISVRDRLAPALAASGSALPDPETTDTIITGVMVGMVAVYGLIALCYALLAAGLVRGRNGARVTGLVVLSIMALCCTCSGVFSFTDQQQNAAVASWYPAFYIGTTWANMLLHVTALVLLALPVSSRYFEQMKAVRAAG